LESNLTEAERRIEEARRTGAEVLDLGDLGLRELPASLGELPRLKALYLGTEKPTEAGGSGWDINRKPPDLSDLSPLSALAGLQRLDLSSCAGVTDLAPLSGLAGLQRLNLLNCTGVTDLAPLPGLAGLQSLDLKSCSGVTNLSPLSGLAGLQSLNLDFCRGVTDLAPLSGLAGLQSLDLSSCAAVTDLAPLSGLAGLQSLRLPYCLGVTNLASLSGLVGLQSLHLCLCLGVTDLAPLSGLVGLQSLNLQLCLGVTDLAPLSGLADLQNLDLSHCAAVTDLSPLSGLADLQNLDLSHCAAVTDLSPLSGPRDLEALNLYGCEPSIPIYLLRVFVNNPRLTRLIADKTAGVPREVLSHSEHDNCLPRLRTYLAELGLAAEDENEVKIILLGNGRVGKTQLCRGFRGESFDESVESTHGVQIWREELPIRNGDQDYVFQVNWWDFGGQDIYHGTHALFLRSRAVFLILWTPELENQKEYKENGIPLRNQPLAYWLDYVRTLAGEDSPVIVVQSQCDRFSDQQPAPQRPNGLGFFQGCAYSAKTNLGRDLLEAQIREAIRYLLERNGALAIGQGRAEVRRRLYGWRGEDQELPSEQRKHRTLTLEDFRALCEEVGGVLSGEHALDYLHLTGVVFYRPDLFSNCIILDQNWALDAVYTVFHRGRAAPLLRDSGRFTREDLAAMVWQEHSIEEQRLFLGLMESCGVCFRCGKAAQGEARYVAPDLLPNFEAIRDRLYAWNEEPDMPTLRLEYRFFHPATIRGLMSRIGWQAQDFAEYWKYGLWLKDGRRNTQLLIQFENTSTNETPGAGVLELKAQGRDPLGLLREIRRTIPWQSTGEKPEEFLTLEGATVARSALKIPIHGCVVDVHGKPVSAAPFAAFFEDREHHPSEADAKIDIQPRALTPSEKPRELFISYAWGDDTPEGKIRAEVADLLYAALEEDGFKPVRDRNAMRPGDSISAFIRRLTRADLVVAVISDKYLRSSYCMHEIYKLWQKSQTAAEDMIERLVPIVLPEVKIGNVRERLPYLRYWAEQAKGLEELIRDPDLRPSSESWEEVRLVREFAHHVDGILVFLQDVLMPRKLEVHFEDGFESVREAVRRRVG
jgi:internalin A